MCPFLFHYFYFYDTNACEVIHFKSNSGVLFYMLLFFLPF